MFDFFRKFFIDGFQRGDYTLGTTHVFALVFTVLSIALLVFLLKGKNEEYVYKRMKLIAYITILVYLARRGIMVYQGETFLKAFWPFYLCNVNTILLSIWIIFDFKKGLDFMIITGISGAVLAFIVPEGVFTDRYLNFQILDSILSHYEIVAVPIVLLATKTYKLDVKNSWIVMIGILLILINVELLQPLIINEKVDYLFLDGNLPFTINGVPQVYILLFCMISYVYIVYYLNYLYNKKMEMIL